ncbi:MAG TPA: hypothetical protein G4O10_07720 [Dehalococcoidia bacterium]|nr:hypothetical protein [Dehalococcoidia bacterium]
MGIIKFVGQKYLQTQKATQVRKLAEVRKSLRKMRSGSPQQRSMVKLELTRLDELSKQLHKVKSREDMKRWRSLYEMCRPAFEAALNLSKPKPRTGKKRTKSVSRK